MITKREAAATLVVTMTVVALGSCQRRLASSRSVPSASASSVATTPIDHLLPGELAESPQLAFGFPVPVGMQVERAFPDALHLVGEVSVLGLTEYVRSHARAGSPELTGSVLRFDNARIPSQEDRRRYRFEITQHGAQVRLLIKDITPALLQPGLSEEERWRQAGLKANGQPIDVSDLR